MSTATETPLERLSHAFQVFAVHCEPVSPLYHCLALRIAEDRELLALAAHTRPGQPAPNMLLGAVHLLLLQGAAHPLAAFYPSVSSAAQPSGDPLPAFRDFCRAHSDAIKQVLATRLTQTNEIRRCAYLLPTFARIARQSGGLPLALVEIGASAGLNLHWDRYSYDYGNGTIYGAPQSQVRLKSAFRGALRPSLPSTELPVAFRIGIDINPLNACDPETVQWLRALVWPEDSERAQALRLALELACADPPPLVAGDVFAVLPEVLARVPAETALCLYHTHVIYQFTPADRERLVALIAADATQRDLYYVACEGVGREHPRLELTTFRGGAASTTLLATTTGHANWIEWLAPEEQ